MTTKKFRKWFESETGNLITPRGRFDLLDVDPISELPVKDYKPNYKNKFEKKEIEPLKTNFENPINKIDTSLNVFDWIKAKVYITKKESEGKMINTLKNFLTGFIVRWILKIGGGFLLSSGVSEGSVTEIVGAVVAIVIGLATSLFQHQKALETDLKTIQR